MHNRRANVTSRTRSILAREAHKYAEHVCHFFELMNIEVPPNTLSIFKIMRKEALQLLYVEELHGEHLESVYIEQSFFQ